MSSENKDHKILFYTTSIIGVIAFGLVSFYYARSSGADYLISSMFFVGGGALYVLTYYLIRVGVKELFDYLMKGRIKASVEVVETQKEEEINVVSQEITTQNLASEPQVHQIVEPTPPKEEAITADNEIKKEQPQIKIDPNDIFMSKKYQQMGPLETRLIADGYLDSDLRWIAKHQNGREDKQRLICFITGLIDSKYFMPNRTPKIKSYFEARYRVTIGQGFEKARREQYITEYKMIFPNYPF